MRTPGPPGLRRAATTVSIGALSMVAISGLHTTMADDRFVIPGMVGLIAAFIASELSHRHHWYLGEYLSCATASFLILGPVAMAELPHPNAYLDLVRSLVTGWSTLLSSSTPTDLTAELRVVPYAVVWLSATIGLAFAQWSTNRILSIIGPATGLGIMISLTIEDARLARLQGAVMAGAALLSATRFRSGRAVGPIMLVLAATLVATRIGPHLPLASLNDRFDLRRHQERPWQALDLPSPLVTLKASLKEGRSDTVVFTVSADVPITRWSIAALDAYDGVVWTINQPRFEPVDTYLPAPDAPLTEVVPVAYELTIGDLDVPWVPVAGWPLEVRSDPRLEIRLNRTTGTLAAPHGLATGTTMSLVTLPRPELSELELRRLSPSTDRTAIDLDLVPPRLRDLAGNVFEGESDPMARALALADTFVNGGFYDHSDAARPGHSLARLDEFLADPDRLVGYGEQYAAAAAVLARLGGAPSRVVVGYVIPPDRYQQGKAIVRAGDIEAWIELQATDGTWVPVTVTPDRSREPQPEQRGHTIRQVAIPNSPPPPPPPPGTASSARSGDSEDDAPEQAIPRDRSTLALLPRPVLLAGSAVVVPMVVLAALAATVMALKRRRSRARRSGAPDRRIIGAWLELSDRYREAGWPTDHSATPSETVKALVRCEPAAAAAADALEALAESVDRAAFHPQAPDELSADQAWRNCDSAIDQLHSARTQWARFRMYTDPRPLIGPGHDRGRHHSR